jgi:hypothetical protein
MPIAKLRYFVCAVHSDVNFEVVVVIFFDLFPALCLQVTFTFQNMAYRAHCDKVVCLSSTLLGSGAPPNITTVSNVHGVREECLLRGFMCTTNDVGAKPRARFTKKVSGGAAVGPFYFLAKKQLAKGYKELLNLTQTPDVLALLDEVGQKLCLLFLLARRALLLQTLSIFLLGGAHRTHRIRP